MGIPLRPDPLALRAMERRSFNRAAAALCDDDGHSSNEELSKPTLSDLGVTRKQCHQWEKLASLDDAIQAIVRLVGVRLDRLLKR
jgi:hypothetical protein